MHDVIDNTARHRFELETPDGVAHLDYELEGDVITLTHTIVPADAQGKGVGTQLVESVLSQSKARGLKVVPLCGFVAAYLRRHPEAATLD
jgi:uncharacterized protein